MPSWIQQVQQGQSHPSLCSSQLQKSKTSMREWCWWEFSFVKIESKRDTSKKSAESDFLFFRFDRLTPSCPLWEYPLASTSMAVFQIRTPYKGGPAPAPTTSLTLSTARAHGFHTAPLLFLGSHKSPLFISLTTHLCFKTLWFMTSQD